MLKTRREFLEVLDSSTPNIVVVAARGTGKSVAASQFVVNKLLSSDKKKAYAVVMSSSLRQCKNTIGAGIDKLCDSFPEGFCKFNASNFTYYFTIAPNDIRRVFLLSYDMEEKKLRGYHPDVLVLDECASMPYSLFGSVVEPMKTKDTKLLAIGTAQGKNRFYELWMRGKSEEYDNWKSYTIKASDSSVFEPSFLLSQRNSLTVAEYAQEYDCDFEANVNFGSVYGDFIRRFTEQNIDDSYCWNPSLPVYTAWDLGISDYTSIWFFQNINGQCTFIDFYEDSGKEISFYADVLLKKPYMYKLAFLPHDGGARNIRGAPIFEQIEKFGIRCQVLSPTSIQSGISAVRDLLKTARFNKENCSLGLEHLKSFKYKIDRKTGMKLSQTEHDEHSHCADAFRYASLAKEHWGKAQASSVNRLHQRASYPDYNVFC